MALPATAVWEVRSTGSDQNGGFYDSAAGTVDYSQQNSPQLSVTDGACSGTTTLTSATGGFTANMVGNGLYLSSGPGWYKINGFTSTNQVTLDRAGPSASGMTVNVGGALASVAKALSLAIGSNIIWVKAGTFNQSANPTVNPGNITPSNSTPHTRLFGYVSARGDATIANQSSWPVIQMQTGCSVGIPLTTNGWWVAGLMIDCGGTGNTTANHSGITSAGQYCTFERIEVRQFKQYGISTTGLRVAVFDIEISNGVSGATYGLHMNNAYTHARRCVVHSNACSGIYMSDGVSLADSLIYSNSGATSDGIELRFAIAVENCVIDNNGRDGIRILFSIALNIRNNIITRNGGYGLHYTVGDYGANSRMWDGNAYRANTSGSRNNLGTGTEDVTLTADPFTDADGGDFSLNNVAGGGAACRAAGIPGLFPGGLTTGYLDFGAAQHQDSGGGGGGAPIIGLGSPLVRGVA